MSLVKEPSKVATMPPGKRWSNAKFDRHIFGYLRLGSVISSSYDVLAAPCPGAGRFAFTLGLNINWAFCAGVFPAAPFVIEYEPNNNPLLEAWFDIHTNGTVPANKPVPPRTWVVWSPLTSQLNPNRGDN